MAFARWTNGPLDWAALSRVVTDWKGGSVGMVFCWQDEDAQPELVR